MLRLPLSLLCCLLLIHCSDSGGPAPDAGVALELAQQRSSAVNNVRYELSLSVPGSVAEPVTGNVAIRFNLLDSIQPLVLDFRAPADHVLDVRLNGAAVDHRVTPDHIVIPPAVLSIGEQHVEVSFRSTDTALNRQAGFFYALFVPDRASTAFPVFEQPNIKARFSLTLEIPAQWQALSNGALLSRDETDTQRHVLKFAETLPISTYLMSFAAGELQIETAVRNGRELTLYHRETDQEKLSRNLSTIFDLHATALNWLEEYTDIAYPFGKFAFFAVPSFQFGGMEHPGAVWYRAESLFLDPTASRTQELGRASLIAHETAHMWFGDLVTMDWFNDVWMKEVFANFLAAKIAEPAFPDLNLDLRFFQAHHPAAYNVDRTAGTNAIRQELDNLNDAGSLYGAIIYQKAPIVLRQLEQLIGEEPLRNGLRQYLDANRFGNATWPDLISVLDPLTEQDLELWSKVWVTAAGRPRITVERVDGGFRLRQVAQDSTSSLLWNQPLVLAVGTTEGVEEYGVQLQEAEAFVAVPGEPVPTFVFAGADGIGYGRFVLDDSSRSALLESVGDLRSPVHRAVVWNSLWEELLDGFIPADAFVLAVLAGIERESDELVAQQLLGLLRSVFWQYLDDGERRAVGASVEAVLWDALGRVFSPGRKGAYFNALVDITITEAGIESLRRIWNGDEVLEGLPLQEQQFIALAEALVLRDPTNADAIIAAQAERITNPDRLARLNFIKPALGGNTAEHAGMLASFADVAVRRQESWVLDAMGALHHPIRNEASLSLLRESLDLTEEIQRTGDIFFPLNWLNATLGGYQSSEAAAIVRQYLDENPDLPERLKGKVLQAVDDLFRAASLQ